MILGKIAADNQAVLPLQVFAANGQVFQLQGVIDTGFSGYLTLSPALIAALGLPFQQRQTFTLGNGSPAEFFVYLAAVLWDGQRREVSVLAADGDALIGMKLLQGFRIFMDVKPNGLVRVKASP